MKPSFFAIFIISLFVATTLAAQPNSDCPSAMLVETMGTITIDSTGGVGGFDNLANTCISSEYSSTWFTWQIDQPGKLTFVLTPFNDLDDLDFAIFKLAEMGDCNMDGLERCMAAGESIGDPNGSLPCMGATGLKLTETDFIEQPGCSQGQNNFLAALDCNEGDQFAMVVNNFSETGGGYTLDWGGTASFFTTTATKDAHATGISIGPNPVKDWLVVSGLFASKPCEFSLFDGMGRKVLAGQLAGTQSGLDVSMLPPGLYLLALRMEGIGFSHKIIVE